MLASYVTYNAAEKDIDCDWDAIKVYEDCVRVAENTELFFEDNGLINTEKTREWASNWAKDYYKKHLSHKYDEDEDTLKKDEYYFNLQKKLKNKYWFVEVEDNSYKYIVVLDKGLYESPDYVKQELDIELYRAGNLEDAFDRFELTRFTVINPDDVIKIKGDEIV